MEPHISHSEESKTFLLPRIIGQKGTIIRIKRLVIGIYIQAHYAVSLGKYLTSTKLRKILFSLRRDLVCVINSEFFLAIKCKILPVPWRNKTNVTAHECLITLIKIVHIYWPQHMQKNAEFVRVSNSMPYFYRLLCLSLLCCVNMSEFVRDICCVYALQISQLSNRT